MSEESFMSDYCLTCEQTREMPSHTRKCDLCENMVPYIRVIVDETGKTVPYKKGLEKNISN